MTNSPSPQAVSLRECPFCGGEAEIIHLDDGDNAGGSCVCCTSCQASGNVEFGRKENFVENWNRRASPADGVVVPRGEVTDEWADRFCEAINWSPDGQECKVVEGEMRCVTFRQIAKGHILAAIATGPDAASPALAATSVDPRLIEWGYPSTEEAIVHLGQLIEDQAAFDGLAATSVNLGAQNGPTVSDPSEYDECLASGGGEVPEGMMTLRDELIDKADELEMMDARGEIWGLEEVWEIMRRAATALTPPSADADKLVIAREALEPFAKIAGDYLTGGLRADLQARAPCLIRKFEPKDFFRARQALAALSATPGEVKGGA